MRTTASQIRPADLVRGIGLTVEFAEPENDFATRLTGTVSTLDPESVEHAKYYTHETQIVLPNDHRVNVRRAFQPGDRVTVPVGYIDFESAEALQFLLGADYVAMEVDEVRADERQVVVFDPNSDEPLSERTRYGVPFRSTRHAV